MVPAPSPASPAGPSILGGNRHNQAFAPGSSTLGLGSLFLSPWKTQVLPCPKDLHLHHIGQLILLLPQTMLQALITQLQPSEVSGCLSS